MGEIWGLHSADCGLRTPRSPLAPLVSVHLNCHRDIMRQYRCLINKRSFSRLFRIRIAVNSTSFSHFPLRAPYERDVYLSDTGIIAMPYRQGGSPPPPLGRILDIYVSH